MAAIRFCLYESTFFQKVIVFFTECTTPKIYNVKSFYGQAGHFSNTLLKFLCEWREIF